MQEFENSMMIWLAMDIANADGNGAIYDPANTDDITAFYNMLWEERKESYPRVSSGIPKLPMTAGDQATITAANMAIDELELLLSKAKWAAETDLRIREAPLPALSFRTSNGCNAYEQPIVFPNADSVAFDYTMNSFTAKVPGDAGIFDIRYDQASGQALLGAVPTEMAEAITYEEVTFTTCHRKDTAACTTSPMITVIVDWFEPSDIVLSKVPWAESNRYPAHEAEAQSITSVGHMLMTIRWAAMGKDENGDVDNSLSAIQFVFANGATTPVFQAEGAE